MTDSLSTQLPPTGSVPPSKKIKLDSVSDGTGEPCGALPGVRGKVA